MPILDLIAILSLGLMIGNELAVSLFVNPALWKLDPSPQARALSLLARSLGKAMPFWYALCLALLIAEAYVRRHGAHAPLLDAAVAVWVIAIVYTVTLMVPINNRLAQMNPDSPFPEWRCKHALWDKLHRLRILMLGMAMACLVWSIVSRS
jgi:uncharacterized membrane protein